MKSAFAVLMLLSISLLAQTPAAPPDESPAAVPPSNLSSTLGTAEQLLMKAPGVIPSPFDFGQMARQKLPVFSLEGMSWTASRFTVEGMTANDPYQPGHPVALPDPGGVHELTLSGSSVPTLSYRFRQPVQSWHGSGSIFA